MRGHLSHCLELREHPRDSTTALPPSTARDRFVVSSRTKEGRSCNITTWMRKIGNNARGNGIAKSRHDYRDCSGHTPSSRNSCCGWSRSHQRQTNQLGNQTRRSVILSARKAKFNLNVLAFDVPEVTKTSRNAPMRAACTEVLDVKPR